MKTKYSIECWLFSPTSTILLLEVIGWNNHLSFMQPITGGIEKNETPEDACIREVFEETGLSVDRLDLKAIVQNYEVYIPQDDIKIIKHLFYTFVEKEISVTISDEHIGYAWVSMDELNERLYWDSNKETYQRIKQDIELNS